MAKVYRSSTYNPDSGLDQLRPGVYGFDCPGCGHSHEVHTSEAKEGWPAWGFNNDLDKPTFTPSLLVRFPWKGVMNICHSFIKEGKIEFLSDCTHGLAGKTVDLKNV